jgi:hypothetical protein
MTAYQMGQEARRKGKSLWTCPFDQWTQRDTFCEWEQGWSDTDDGIKERERKAEERFDSLFAA